MSGAPQTAAPGAVMDAIGIGRVLPHRYPFRLLDRVLELEVGKRAVGLKNVTINEPYFVGHFPSRPIVPGVIIIEALAQLGGVALLQMPQYQDKLLLFTGIDEMRFRRPVVPGDQMILTAEVIRLRSSVARCRGTATVDGHMAAEGIFLCTLVDWEHEQEP